MASIAGKQFEPQPVTPGFHVLAVLLPIQMLADIPDKAAENDPIL